MKPQNLAKMQKLQEQARQRILERGKIEFRADPDVVAALLDLAHTRRTPLGPMIRQWVIERLAQETSKSTTYSNQLDIIIQKVSEVDELLHSYKTTEFK
jgi:hypothetical protein